MAESKAESKVEVETFEEKVENFAEDNNFKVQFFFVLIVFISDVIIFYHYYYYYYSVTVETIRYFCSNFVILVV